MTSTWNNITNGLHAAVYDSYTAKKIVHDWSGFYYDGTVYTDAEEEEMIRKQFNIPKSA